MKDIRRTLIGCMKAFEVSDFMIHKEHTKNIRRMI